jgi:hypothetical protein
MAIKSSKKSFGNNRTINYIGKDFGAFRRNLIDFAKSYYPDTYSDFNEASPGMVFIEMASYIGDVLAFYQDTQLKESMLQHATERKNIIALAQTMGYKPKVTTPAVTNLTIYQLVPAIGSGENNKPDSEYFLKIKPGLEVTSTSDSSIKFRTTDFVDFENPNDREISIYSRNEITGEPEFYLITKKAKAISAVQVEKTIVIPSTETEYPTITLSETNIIEISSITEDGSNDKWHEVPYLGQEMAFVEYPNNFINGKLSDYNDSVPYILELKKVPKRFSYKVNTDNSFEIEFGAGNANINDELVFPNPKNVGLGLTNSIKRLNNDIDPSNFLKSNTFGVSPAGKSLTIKYLIGGGLNSNVNTGDLITISNIEYEEDLLSIFNPLLYQTVKDSVALENLEPAVGGRGGESVEEIRQNALATFGTQNRAVTRQDYAVRALNMPARYGSVAKVYVAADSENDSETAGSFLSNPKNAIEFTNFVNRIIDIEDQTDRDNEIKKFISQKRMPGIQVNNPFAINMYLLGYDINGKLTNVNPAVKQNLKTYLSEYRMLTDVVNLVDGFIVNIGVEFDIIVYSNYNKTEVLANCLTELKNHFNIENWSFNKPINVSELELILANVEGVMSVPKVIVTNLFGEEAGYAAYGYNIENATVGKIIYPSLDPCVFEVKYPNKDIKGRAL